MKDKAFTQYAVLSGLIFLMLAISGCSLFSDGSGTQPEFQVNIDKQEVESGESFRVDLSVFNPSNEKITITTSCKQFAALFIYKDDKRVDFIGDQSGCVRKVNTYEIEPLEKLSFDWSLETTVVSWNPETMSADTAFAVPGVYDVEIKPHFSSVNGQEIDRERFRKTLVVR